jgi:hypothetical protein
MPVSWAIRLSPDILEMFQAVPRGLERFSVGC